LARLERTVTGYRIMLVPLQWRIQGRLTYRKCKGYEIRRKPKCSWGTGWLRCRGGSRAAAFLQRVGMGAMLPPQNLDLPQVAPYFSHIKPITCYILRK